MGGCCCKGAEFNSTPRYYYYPRASDEHIPLSSRHGVTSAMSSGLLVDTNLDTSVPDAYRPPPAPTPFDVVLRSPHAPQVAAETCSNRNDGTVPTTDSGSDQETAGVNTQETLTKCEDKGLHCKAESDLELSSEKEKKNELSKPFESLVLEIEEEVCPTCLEEYDAENPKITTKCEHHFHLACILEWKERSDTCPVCDQEMIIEPAID
uniref:RING-type E3 ubiquitin transferase n=1 Tax=Rhizophora mucronata TaxID=61149 RepID=A0A2P2INM4_RHIMU